MDAGGEEAVAAAGGAVRSVGKEAGAMVAAGKHPACGAAVVAEAVVGNGAEHQRPQKARWAPIVGEGEGRSGGNYFPCPESWKKDIELIK